MADLNTIQPGTGRTFTESGTSVNMADLAKNSMFGYAGGFYFSTGQAHTASTGKTFLICATNAQFSAITMNALTPQKSDSDSFTGATYYHNGWIPFYVDSFTLSSGQVYAKEVTPV